MEQLEVCKNFELARGITEFIPRDLRVWKFPSEITWPNTFNWFKKAVNASKTYLYSLEFPGNYLEKDTTKTYGDLMIADDDILVFEHYTYWW